MPVPSFRLLSDEMPSSGLGWRSYLQPEPAGQDYVPLPGYRMPPAIAPANASFQSMLPVVAARNEVADLRSAKEGLQAQDAWVARQPLTLARLLQYLGVGVPPMPPAIGQYETPLTAEEETSFRVWKSKYAPQDSGEDYDLRGAFKAGLQPEVQTGHWPDTYKKPNHPTFSNQSVYATQRPELAGRWEGETYIPPER